MLTQKRAFVSALLVQLFRIFLFGSWGVQAPMALANDVEGAAGYYWDEQLTVTIKAITGSYETRKFFEGEGRATNVRLGYTGKTLAFKEIGDLLEKQLKGKDEIEQHSLSASLDQGLRVGTQIGLLGGMTSSPLGSSRNLGGRVSQWWLLETLQTTLEVRQNSMTQAVLDYTDTDGKHVVTPEELSGLSLTFSTLHFATPTTIIRSSVARTTRSDRPPADGITAEVRQFIAPTRSAVHLALNHYENVGPIEPKTQYGTIVANGVRAEWHQRLPKKLILMGGYRYYVEVENPRAADADNKQVGTDSIYSSIRWRFGHKVWAGDSHELYGYMARYTTNTPTTAYMIGLGCRYLL